MLNKLPIAITVRPDVGDTIKSEFETGTKEPELFTDQSAFAAPSLLGIAVYYDNDQEEEILAFYDETTLRVYLERNKV